MARGKISLYRRTKENIGDVPKRPINSGEWELRMFGNVEVVKGLRISEASKKFQECVNSQIKAYKEAKK